MDQDLVQRAVEGLGHYCFQVLEKWRRQERKKEPEDGEHELSEMAETAERQVIPWFNGKLKKWNRQGRLREDGTVRVLNVQLEPWTLRRIGKIWPKLNEWDRIAVLVDLDGKMGRTWMDAHENVRAVIDEIVDLRISQIFGEVLMGLRRGDAAMDNRDKPTHERRTRRPYRKRQKDPLGKSE